MENDFKKIESKWQKKWEAKKIFEVNEKSKKPKYYVLDMFPYPSGEGLHMGHAFVFSLGDIFARFKRLQGNNVLYPGGYDSLGLPAENAAIKAGIHPEKYTADSIKNFKKQQKAMGWSYDWSRSVKTSDPEYYKWDQWIFLKMFEKGFAYQKESAVNWCPKCNTVLANEQVTDGKCWRHEDTSVRVKHLKQWFLKITDYVEELLDHSKLDWPDKAKRIQKNWIGKSYGTEINFEINSKNPKGETSSRPWPIFTTRPDTIYGVTFMVVSAQHFKLDDLVTKEQRKEVDGFLKKLKSVSEKELENMEKEGVFTGSYATNPLTGDKVPVYAGNFVVADYGSGMVMAVPAHDKRDFEFARKYKIPVKVVIGSEGSEESPEKMANAYVGDGILMNSEEFNGINNREAIDKITQHLAKKKLGKKTVQYKLRDWLISRQRYWGTPIPMIYCDKCGIVPVPEKNLPIKLPKDVKFGKGNPLETNKKFTDVKCPKCKGNARRETDTMDTFANSSWYYLRYADAQNKKEIFDKKKANYWCPVDQYIGGPEHITMHLIYIRFYTKFLRDLGLLNFDEPALRYFTQGIVNDAKGEKMSKSKGNVVEPLPIIEKYGADTLRLALVSVASPDNSFNWDEKILIGSHKFLVKVKNNFENVKIGKSDAKIESKLNKIIKEVTNQIENFKYNLAVIKIRDLFNSLGDEESKVVLEKSLKLLHPFCPHLTEELWAKIGNKKFISLETWPIVEEKKIDSSLDKQEEAIEKIVGDINHISNLVKGGSSSLASSSKNQERKKKVFIYVLPNEKALYAGELDSIKKRTQLDVEVFAVNDKDKHDPENKSKKVKPGRPGIYLE